MRRDLLRDIAQMSDADWAAIGRGEAVAKVLATDTREVAVAGAVRIASSSERLVGRYREIESLKRSAIVLEIGRFSKPPRPADLAAVPFEDYSLDLRTAGRGLPSPAGRAGDCAPTARWTGAPPIGASGRARLA